MRTIRIMDNVDWLWSSVENGKEEIAGSVEAFDDNIVIHGNRSYNAYENAKWYKEAMLLINEWDEEFTREDYLEFTDEQYKSLKELIENPPRYADDNENIARIVNILHPERKIIAATIRGYSQSDWQNVLYDANAGIDIDWIEAVYFGKIKDVFDEESFNSTIITNNALWDAEREGNLQEKIYEWLNIPNDELIKVFVQDGYTQVVNWKEVH